MVAAIHKDSEILPLTSLRFLAALYVILFHSFDLFFPNVRLGRYEHSILHLGFVTVSLFFVLSGFILARVYLDRPIDLPISPKRFWRSRFARVYPLYVVAQVAFLPFVWSNLGYHSQQYKVAKMVGLSAIQVLALQAWHPALVAGWNTPAWSISAEAFFYFSFPLMGRWLWQRTSHPVIVGLLIWSFGVLLTSSLVFAFPDVSCDLLRFNPLLRLPEFCAGICAAKWASQGQVAMKGWVAVLCAVAYLLIVPWLSRLPGAVVSNGLITPLAVVAIVGLTDVKSWIGRLLSRSMFVHLGRSSYGMYVLHFPVLFWMLKIGEMESGRHHKTYLGGNSPGQFCIYLFALAVLSLLSYHFLEAPVRIAIAGPPALREGLLAAPATT